MRMLIHSEGAQSLTVAAGVSIKEEADLFYLLQEDGKPPRDWALFRVESSYNGWQALIAATLMLLQVIL